MASAKTRFIALVGLPAALALATLIPKEEGVVLKTYRDPVGILTSCMGHTGPELKLGQVFTRAQCDETMYLDLIKHAEPVIKCAGPMDGPKTVSAIDFGYNKGVYAFCNSGFAQKLKAKDPAACEEPLRWVYATKNGRKLDCRIRSNDCYGLVLRAERTKRLCQGDTSDLGIEIDWTLTAETQDGTP